MGCGSGARLGKAGGAWGGFGLEGWVRFSVDVGASSGVGWVRSMTPESTGSRVGGFGGEELRAATEGAAGEEDDSDGGAGTVAGGTRGLEWGTGFLAAAKAGEAVCDGGLAIFGPGERCSVRFSAGRLAGIVDGTAAG